MPRWKELLSVWGCVRSESQEGWGGIQALILSLLAGTGSGQGQRAGLWPPAHSLAREVGAPCQKPGLGMGTERTFQETSVRAHGWFTWLCFLKKYVIILFFFNFQVNKSLSACFNSPL